VTPPDAGPPVDPAAAGAPGRAPGDAVRRLVAVMDTLRSPGGCPWDAEQTHESLVPFALEEAHELAEAIEAGDRAGMREELGDVLLQVVFHARLAQEHETDPFDLDDVAAGLTAKLVRRHPHVFEPVAGSDGDTTAAPPAGTGAGTAAGTAAGTGAGTHAGTDAGSEIGTADLHVRWEQIKRAEKSRASVLDGIPLGQGALSRGHKVLARARRGGVDVDVARVAERHVTAAPPERAGSAAIGARLLLLVEEAADAGVDAEAALRAALRTLDATVRETEAR
jgi:XTP/dITP diphosphohydrolase